MKTKKILALLLAVALVGCLFGCTGGGDDNTSTTGGSNAPEATGTWADYDALISQIRSSTDFVAREALMHKAEDMLMDTGAVVPIYYYNDIFMMKPGFEGFYSNVYGTKFFMYATYGEAKTLRICLASEPAHLDPALNSSVDGACLAANSFSGLTTYDANGAVVLALAKEYTTSEDGLTWTFTLKDDLKWSDGTALTAADFEYSWKRAVNPETAADYAYMFAPIAGFDDVVTYSATEKDEDGNPVVESYDVDKLQVKASEDGKTFTVTLSAPCAYFLDLCAFPTFLPVFRTEVESAEGYKDENGKVIDAGAWGREAGFVSNGAFVLESWTHGESMVYVKNANYWDAANVKVEKLEFMLSDDDVATFAAYNDNSIDFTDTVPNGEIQGLLNNPEFYIIDNLGTYYVCFNVKSDTFAHLTTEQANTARKALGLLIDRNYIVETCGQTGQLPANAFIPAKMLDGHGGEFKATDDAYTYPVADETGYYSVKAENYEANVAKAIEMLTSVGYKFTDGKLDASTPISFEYLTNTNTGHEAIAACIQSDFADLGITMQVKSIEWNTFLEERKLGNFTIARNGWIADFNDPINMLEMWLTDSGNNDAQLGK